MDASCCSLRNRRPPWRRPRKRRLRLYTCQMGRSDKHAAQDGALPLTSDRNRVFETLPYYIRGGEAVQQPQTTPAGSGGIGDACCVIAVAARPGSELQALGCAAP